MTPATLPRRYAAWSLDAAALAVIAGLACHAGIAAGIEASRVALSSVANAMVSTMLEGMQHDASMLSLALMLQSDPALRAGVSALATALGAMLGPPLLVFVLLDAASHAWLESSRWQATPGKRALRLRVVGEDGGRIGFPRAVLRHVAGALSWLTLNVGHLMATAPPRRQALHDRVARTQVVQDTAEDLPAWAKAWLVLQAAIALAALAWALQTTNAALEAALDGMLPI